jgi:hypothetical protein
MSISLRAVPRESIIDQEVVSLILQSPGSKELPSDDKFRLLSLSLRKNHNRRCSSEELKQKAELIITGKKIPILPSLFHGVVGPRQGKDAAYRHFWSLVRKYVKKYQDRHYVGLAANQIGSLPVLVGGSIDVCEKDKKLVEWQKQYASLLDMEVSIHNEDIFSFCEGRAKYNIIDLDLMTIATMAFVEKTVKAISEAAAEKGNVVINLTSCIGRAISWAQYREIMPVALLDGLVDKWFNVVEVKSSTYRDRHVPLAVEQLVIRR